MADQSRPIQTATAGLLSLLQVKNRGQNPDVLEGNVQPVLDMVPWWLRGDSIPGDLITVLSAVSENFSFDLVTAGNSDWLYIHCARVNLFTAVAGANVQLLLFKSIPGQSSIIWASPIEVAVAQHGAFTATAEVRDLWVPPGYQLLGAVADAAIGNELKMGALTTRVRI